MARHIATLLAAFCCLTYAAGQQSNVIDVEVFYESLCPDSIYFITKELAPAYDGLKDFLNVKLVPFGKASWVIGNGEYQTDFNCQHGPMECFGNKAQACALHEIQASVAADQQQRQSVKVVDCAMSNRNPPRAVPQCAQNIGLSQESIDRIKSCSDSDLGNQLLIKMGERTNEALPRISFVPSILINGVKNSSAFNNFGRVICEMIPREQQPQRCRDF